MAPSNRELQEAKDFIEGLGIEPNHALYDAAIQWFIEKKQNNIPIFEKPQYKDYVDYIVLKAKGGLPAFQKKKIYKQIISQIQQIANANSVTGNPPQTPQASQRPPQASTRSSRPRSGGRPRQGQRVNQPTGNKKVIKEKLTTSLVYGEPKYNQFEIIFENDFDKVAYILRNKKTESRKHHDYFAWARRVSGQTDDVIRAHGNKVLDKIKESVSTGDTRGNKIVIEAIPLDFTPPDLRAQRNQPGVNVASFLNRPTAAGPGEGLMNRSANAAANVGHGESYESVLESLKNIQKSVDKILDILANQQAFANRVAERNRRLEEKRKRESKESLTEKSIKGFIKEAVKLFAPVQGILDRIINFIVYTLLGRAMVALIKWVSDPANRNKVKSIARFLKDWWPILLGTYVLFFTQFGKVIRGAIGLSIKLTRLMLKTLPELLRGAKGLGRWGKIGVAAATIGTIAIGTGLYLKGKSEEKDNKTKEKPPTPQPQTKAYRSGGMIGRRPKKLNINQIKTGGPITNRSGVQITGAGQDTQLIAAQPGEYIISKAGVDAANKMYGEGFLEGLNKMAGASGIPKVVNNIQLASEGGPVGGRPKIKPEDYYSLLAIAAAEDSTPQGRADVAQSIYNRLYAGGDPYNMNFNTTAGRNSIKDIITGPKQYQPTFNNRQDWMSIKDKKSAAKALAGYLAGRAERIGSVTSADLKEAMKMINDTEKAIRSSKLQESASKFVQGRLSFYGTSERKHMEGDDVIRMNKVGGKMVDARGNSFSHHLADESKSPYAKDRRRIAAPVPAGIATPPPKPKPKSIGEQFINTIFGVFNQITSPTNIKASPNIQTPRQRVRRESVSVLPPLDMTTQKRAPKYNSPVSVDIPSFPLYVPSIVSDRTTVKDKLGMAA